MENLENNETINVIATGCIHGSILKMYKDIQKYAKSNNIKIDLVLCTGDFESIRDENDLSYLECPEKYRKMGDFCQYYKKELVAPYLTIFIGGNHEASNFLEENYYGGFVCKNIYYLGRCGVVNYKGLRIGGISGIFKEFDYFKGHYEGKGYKNKSLFHIREFEIAKLSYIKNHIDIFMTHDWPTNLIKKEDFYKVSKKNPEMLGELQKGILGSFPNTFLLSKLKPSYFICSHMHYFYQNEINGTKLFALDKCLNNRKYFQMISIKNEKIDLLDDNIYIDQEWAAITNTFNNYLPLQKECYSLINLFDENSKEEYRNIVLHKIINNTKFENVIESTPDYDSTQINKNIDDLLMNKLINKKFIQIVEGKTQTECLLKILKIPNIENKHLYSK